MGQRSRLRCALSFPGFHTKRVYIVITITGFCTNSHSFQDGAESDEDSHGSRVSAHRSSISPAGISKCGSGYG